MRLRAIFVFLAVFSIFGVSLQMPDGSTVSGDKLLYQADDIILDGKPYSRDDVLKITVSRQKSTLYDVDLSFPLADSTLENYRDIAAEMEEKYPLAAGLTIYFHEHRIIKDDGRDISHVHSVRKVLSSQTKGWASQSFYAIDGENHITILAARSIDSEGNVYDLDPASVVISEPARSGAFYGEGRNISFTIPNVEEGSLIDLVYIDESYAPEDPNLLRVSYYFQGREPSHLDRLDVEIPMHRELFYISQYLDDYYLDNFVTNIPDSPIPPSEVENPTKALITETDSSRIYTWQMTYIAPFISESDMPANSDVTPRVEAGFYSDFEYYNKRYSRIYEEHMQSTPVLDSVAWSVVSDAETDKEKAMHLYHWVQRNIRYISIKGTLASSKGGHFAQITYDNRYGDCSDKAVLFATLLRIVGVEAYPISLMTNDDGFVNRGVFPSLRTNNCINEVWCDGKPHVLDATGTNMRFPYYNRGDCDIWYCNYMRGEAVYNPPFPPEDNMLAIHRQVEIDDYGNAQSIDSMYFTGTLETWYRGFFERNPEENRRQYLEKRANNLKPGSRLRDYRAYNIENIQEPFSVSYEYTTPRYFVRAGSYFLLSSGASYSFPEVSLNERRYPLKVSMPEMKKHRIHFQTEFPIVHLPDSIHVENEYFSFFARWSNTGIGVLYEDEFRQKEIRVPVEDYQQYRVDAQRILSFTRQRVFLGTF